MELYFISSIDYTFMPLHLGTGIRRCWFAFWRQHFGETCFSIFRETVAMFLRNASIYFAARTASQPRRIASSLKCLSIHQHLGAWFRNSVSIAHRLLWLLSTCRNNFLAFIFIFVSVTFQPIPSFSFISFIYFLICISCSYPPAPLSLISYLLLSFLPLFILFLLALQ